MILPLYANLEKHDMALLEAAADLGARPLTAFLRVTLPQSLPGIAAGSLLVFIPTVGEYVIPTLLGRTDQIMIGRMLSDEFFDNRDWPVASGVAILILLALVVPIVLLQRVERSEPGDGRVRRRGGLFSRTALFLGLVFLYVPILSMIVYSFNNSRLVTVWDAAHSPTLKWYGVLLSDDEVLDAAWLSLRVAICAATASTILGTLAGTALARFGAFRGRSLLVGMTTAPHRHAGSDQAAFAAAPLRGPAAGHRLAAGHGRAHDHARPHLLLHGLRHGGGTVTPGRLR